MSGGTARSGGAAEAADDGTIFVLAPVHNRRALTERFVRCLAQQTDQGFRLVLVDDGSTDGTADAVRSMIPEAMIIRGKGDWWWAGSLQQARRWLLAQPTTPEDIVLIANDDTIFGPEFLANARSVLASSPRTLLLAQPENNTSADGSGPGVRIDWSRLTLRPTEDTATADCFPTRGLFLRLQDFLALGPFHEILLPHYLSDYEWTLRASRRGYRMRTADSVRLVRDDLATGIRARDVTSVRAYLRSVFTIKATKNPIYWSTFVLLASPRRYLAGNLFRVWRKFAVGLLVAAGLRPARGR